MTAEAELNYAELYDDEEEEMEAAEQHWGQYVDPYMAQQQGHVVPGTNPMYYPPQGYPAQYPMNTVDYNMMAASGYCNVDPKNLPNIPASTSEQTTVTSDDTIKTNH